MVKTDFFRIKESFFENLSCTACGSCIKNALRFLDGIENVAINPFKSGIEVTYHQGKIAKYEIEYYLLEHGLLWMRQLKPAKNTLIL